MNKKSSSLTQRYFDAEKIVALQNKLEARLNTTSDSGLRLDVMIAFSLLTDCFKAGFIERVDE